MDSPPDFGLTMDSPPDFGLATGHLCGDEGHELAPPIDRSPNAGLETVGARTEAKFYEIDFLSSFFETRPHAAQMIRGWVLVECDVGSLQFLGPLVAKRPPRDHTAARLHMESPPRSTQQARGGVQQARKTDADRSH